MRIKTMPWGLMGVALLFAWQIQPLEAATPLKKLGTAPFFKAKDLKADEVYTILKRVEKDVKAGFSLAGADALFEPFMKQIQNRAPEAVNIQPGQSLQWMMYKKKGKVLVTRDRVWAGQNPFEAYRVLVQHNNQDYEFILPKICLNISLKKVTPVPAVTTAPTPKPAETTRPGTPPPSAETSKTAHPAKEPETKTAAPVASVPIAPPSAKDSEKTKGEARKGFFVGDLGPLFRFDVSLFAQARAGYRYKFTEQMALTGLVGGAFLIKGDDDHPAFLADLIFSYFPVRQMFLEAGVGLWASSQDAKADLILGFGFPLETNSKNFNLEFYVEGRSAFDQMGDWSKYGRAGGGLRILF
jgi:hypothetical protein